MWNDELAGGVFIKHQFCLCACVLTEGADGAKQQPHKGNGCSHIYLMAGHWIWPSYIALDLENKSIHFIKVSVIGWVREGSYTYFVRTWTIINLVPFAQMFVHLICIIFVRFCILYNNPIPLLCNWIIKNAYWCVVSNGKWWHRGCW